MGEVTEVRCELGLCEPHTLPVCQLFIVTSGPGMDVPKECGIQALYPMIADFWGLLLYSPLFTINSKVLPLSLPYGPQLLHWGKGSVLIGNKRWGAAGVLVSERPGLESRFPHLLAVCV